jgi:hypothetical protein
LRNLFMTVTPGVRPHSSDGNPCDVFVPLGAGGSRRRAAVKIPPPEGDFGAILAQRLPAGQGTPHGYRVFFTCPAKRMARNWDNSHVALGTGAPFPHVSR